MADIREKSVSICIASYNMADTIEESLRSIIEGLPQNFEVVVVDQSTDGSKRIIEEIASESDLEFKLIHTDFPLGVGHARNLAVCEATGDVVITHVDADDSYRSEYLPALVELYLELTKERGSEFFFSCPNMNISSRKFMKQNYLLTSLPIGANEKEYRWRAHRNEEFLQVEVSDQVSKRIKLSDRKTIWSRIKRTYSRHLGMYRIGYSTKRIVKEDIFERPWPIYSRIFRAAIIPIVWLHSLFLETVCHAPLGEKTLSRKTSEQTYKVKGLKQKYNISKRLAIEDLIDSN